MSRKNSNGFASGFSSKVHLKNLSLPLKSITLLQGGAWAGFGPNGMFITGSSIFDTIEFLRKSMLFTNNTKNNERYRKLSNLLKLNIQLDSRDRIVSVRAKN
jgi:hypothetical protein